jgi:hypothetical protein
VLLSQVSRVLHRDDCPRRSDALPWAPSARYGNDDELAQVVLHRFTWFKLCPHCFRDIAPPRKHVNRRRWTRKKTIMDLSPADPATCARPDCGNPLPPGRRKDAIYCCRRCTTFMADRARNDRNQGLA